MCVCVLLQEKAAFGRGLEETMDVWYAHQMIATIFVTWLPEWYTSKPDARIYESRGWTFFERSSAELIKPAKAYVVEEGKTIDTGRFLWSMAIDSSASDANQGRRPPLAPAAFREQLRSRKFTNNADAEAVANLFEKTATSVLHSTKKL